MNDDEAGFDQPSSQATSTQQSSQSGKGKFRSTDAQSVLPVCVYQIQTAKHDSNDSSFRIGNTEVNVVTIVAKVDSIEVKPQKTVIMVSDGTGLIEVNLWIDQNANNYLSQQRDIAQYVYVSFLLIICRPGKYVRIYGHLRSWENKNSIFSLKIKPVTDFNEITFHNCDIIYAHLYAKHGPVSGSAAANKSVLNDSQHEDFFQEEVKPSEQATEVLDTVRKTIKQLGGRSPNGVKIDTVIQNLSSKFGTADIKDAIQSLLSEGIIFCTTGEEYVKAH